MIRDHLAATTAAVGVLLGCVASLADEPEVKGTHFMSSSTDASHTNRLIRATSPYLRQHAHNPVDWYEWGAEPLQRARDEQKPIFLSIGYAACHWCHVMAHESFEDEAIAALMNENFINIKVDREVRPDIDEIYMQATLVLNQGNGGWPMSVWLTPDLKPFFAGTYFPPTARYGRPGFRELCKRIGEAWREDRAKLETGADQLTDIIRQGLYKKTGTGDALDLALVEKTADQLAGAFDPEHGGMLSGGTNKFPPSMALDLLFRSAVRMPADAPQRKKYLDLANLTLEKMAKGGIYDQLGGGFHRYSTDLTWHVPHFEKMLYDQALVSRAYLDAYQLTQKPMYECIVRETFDYVLGDLQSPAGGFYSTRDADSEGEEGRYYVWTRAEALAILGDELGTAFCNHYDITKTGNWRDPHNPDVPKNIPRILRCSKTCAAYHGVPPTEFERQMLEGREKLLAARAKRVPPALDDKILVEWNGLMISSLARGGAVLGEQKYIDAAAQAANFILENQYKNGHLLRAYRDGSVLEAAFLSDYACFIEGLLELYEATFDRRWLDTAVKLNDTVVQHFWDEDGGGFFFTPDDHEELLVRTKDVRDGAVPSGNSVQLMNLLRLAVMLGDESLQNMAEQTMRVFADDVRQSPWSAERFLAAVGFAQAGPVELAIVGDPKSAATQALLREINKHYLPNRVVMLRNPNTDHALDVPLLKDRPQIDHQPTAYVCRDYTCQRPVTAPAELSAQLSQSAPQ